MSKPPEKSAQKIAGFTAKDLRSKYDNVFKIREGVKKLKAGIYLSDQQMRELCKVPINLWRACAEKAEFDKFKYKPNAKDIYWGTPQSIRRELRGEDYE